MRTVHFQSDMDVCRFRAILPTGPSDLANVQQQLPDIDQLKIVIASLAGEILNPLDRLGAVLRGLNDDVQTFFDFRRVSGFQQQLRASQDSGQRVIKVVRHT